MAYEGGLNFELQIRAGRRPAGPGVTSRVCLGWDGFQISTNNVISPDELSVVVKFPRRLHSGPLKLKCPVGSSRSVGLKRLKMSVRLTFDDCLVYARPLDILCYSRNPRFRTGPSARCNSATRYSFRFLKYWVRSTLVTVPKRKTCCRVISELLSLHLQLSFCPQSVTETLFTAN